MLVDRYANCSDTLHAPLRIALAAREGGSVAADAESRKQSRLIVPFCSFAIETLGVCTQSRVKSELPRHVAAISNEPHSHQFLVQRL